MSTMQGRRASRAAADSGVQGFVFHLGTAPGARETPESTRLRAKEGVMFRLRSRLIALVIAFPLLMIAFVTWSIADDPTVEPQYFGAGNTVPVWQLAGLTITACLPLL